VHSHITAGPLKVNNAAYLFQKLLALPVKHSNLTLSQNTAVNYGWINYPSKHKKYTSGLYPTIQSNNANGTGPLDTPLLLHDVIYWVIHDLWTLLQEVIS
jgi:hypothetical protein